MKVLFAGGGTGGHVYPAIALADEFVKRGDRVHFVGTSNHVEARIVPQNNYSISFIWVSGFQRTLTVKNLLFPIKLFTSLIQSFFIIKKFKPDLVIGTGGYVSGPVVFMASLLKKKTIIQEQNSYPGVTTKLLHSKVDEVHIAYDEAKKYLSKSKSVKRSGNPTRNQERAKSKTDILSALKLKDQFTISVIGGSLGAKSINDAIAKLIDDKLLVDVNIIWQTGEKTFHEYERFHSENNHIAPFFSNMNDIYSVTDLIICRAGAMTLAEVQNNQVPAIIIPYKYATGNHQFHNAKSLEMAGAAKLIIDDSELDKNLKYVLENILNNTSTREEMRNQMSTFSNLNSVNDIVDSAYHLVKE